MNKQVESMRANSGDSGSDPWVDGQTIGQVLRRTATRHPDDLAVVFASLHWQATWRQFDALVDRCARSLLACGFARGDHFGVWATNVSQWLILQFATARIGVVLVTINPSYRSNELAFVVRHADLKGIALIDRFRTTDYYQSLLEAIPQVTAGHNGSVSAPDYPKLKLVVSLRGQPLRGTIGWDEFMQWSDRVPQENLTAVESGLSCKDPINIQFTSGTTGRPKGAVLSHRNILLNAYYTGVCQALTNQDRLAIPVPLYHCFGCVLGSLCCCVHGVRMVFPAEGFQADQTLSAIQSQQCTAIYGVPTMFIAMIEHEQYAKTNLRSLRTGIMAGSPCPIELMKRVTSEMGAREITIGYGQTESSPIITQTHTTDSLELRVGTVGRPLPGVEVKIIDPNNGQQLSDGQSGELCTRGHHVMLGYYNQPDTTAVAIDGDGWLRTGDLAVREPNGHFRITGRLRDLVIRGGENIYPREVEEVLYTHPAICDVQVIGVPDRKFGEEVMAWVCLREGCSTSGEQLREFCLQRMARFKVPRYWKFVESFPTTVTGKIQKFKMRETSIEELGLQEVANIATA